MPFTFLDHTADVQVECRAATFAELLETAANALYAVALKEVREEKDHVADLVPKFNLGTRSATSDVSLLASCREELLVRWLHELLFLLDTEHFVAKEITFGRVTAESLDAAIRGYHCTADDRADEIKAVTYHDLKIEETPEGLVARVIFNL